MGKYSYANDAAERGAAGDAQSMGASERIAQKRLENEPG
jgi:hypothetical protein